MRNRIALSLVPAWLGVVSIACGPARGGEVQQPPGAAPAQAAELSSPTAVPTEAKPTAGPTEPPKSEKLIIPTPSEVPDQLDSVSSSIKAIQKPLDPKDTEARFGERKAAVERSVQAAKEALAKGDIENARKILGELKARIADLGDPLKTTFIPKSIRDQIDPQEKVLKRTDIIDPALRDQYLGVVKVELALSGFSGKG